ncbi:hypothetical protein ONZ45_g9862 [Pleurotus djamor]|nr:hypothetical protein ONZ45_g9862 [Pleurotus djamor]
MEVEQETGSKYKPASAPFDRSDADMVFRSSDGVDFRVHKIIFRLTSPFFENLLSVPQPTEKSPEEYSDGAPVIPFTEDSATLDLMLRFCYPGDNPDQGTAEQLTKVLVAAEKYQIASLIRSLEQVYLSWGRGEIGNRPVKVFILACRYRWGKVAEACARSSLSHTTGALMKQFEQVDVTSFGNQCIALLRYHANCSSEIRECFDSHAEGAHSEIVMSARDKIYTEGPMGGIEALDMEVSELMEAMYYDPECEEEELDNLPRQLRDDMNYIIGKQK